MWLDSSASCRKTAITPTTWVVGVMACVQPLLLDSPPFGRNLSDCQHQSSQKATSRPQPPARQGNILHCCSRIKAHASKQLAKARLTSQPIEPRVHLEPHQRSIAL